ncbi:MAG: ferrous iron transport protein A [Faecousia sp.]
METTMNRLREGQCARVTSLGLTGELRRRLLDFGLIEGTEVRCLRISPAGSPVLYRVRGTLLALRTADSGRIRVEVDGCV